MEHANGNAQTRETDPASRERRSAEASQDVRTPGTPPLPGREHSQRSLLGLQRTAGNHAVAQLVQKQGREGKSTAAVASVQRQHRDGQEDPVRAAVRIGGEYDDLFNGVVTMQADVQRRVNAWERTYRNAGSAYALAYLRHQTACQLAAKEAAEQAAVIAQVASVLLTGLTAYGSSLVQASATLTARQELVVNAVEDAFQVSVDKSATMAGQAAAERPESSGGVDIPLVFQNRFMNQTSEAHDGILGNLITTLNAIRAAKTAARTALLEPRVRPPLLEATPDVAEQDRHLATVRQQVNSFETAVRDSPVYANAAPSIDVNTAADQYERVMWSLWMPSLRSNPSGLFPTPGDLWGFVDPYVSPGTPVERRLDALGITRAAGVGEFGGWTSNEEVEQIIAWGASYQPEPVVPELEGNGGGGGGSGGGSGATGGGSPSQ